MNTFKIIHAYTVETGFGGQWFPHPEVNIIEKARTLLLDCRTHRNGYGVEYRITKIERIELRTILSD